MMGTKIDSGGVVIKIGLMKLRRSHMVRISLMLATALLVVLALYLDINWNPIVAFFSERDVILALVLLFVTYRWNLRTENLQNLERRAAVSVEITPEDIITVTNHGKVPVIISEVSTSSIHVGRETAREGSLLETFQKLKGELVESLVGKATTLAIGEKMTLFINQEGKLGAIEENELIVQVVRIKMQSGRHSYEKYVGIYRLTSPVESFLWEATQSGEASFKGALKKLCEEGRKYPLGKVVDRIIYESRKQTPDKDIIPTPAAAAQVKEASKNYERLNKIGIVGVPEDHWYIFRIEENLIVD